MLRLVAVVSDRAVDVCWALALGFDTGEGSRVAGVIGQPGIGKQLERGEPAVAFQSQKPAAVLKHDRQLGRIGFALLDHVAS